MVSCRDLKQCRLGYVLILQAVRAMRSLGIYVGKLVLTKNVAAMGKINFTLRLSHKNSDCHGFKNPHGLQVGYAGVRVRVGFLQPSPYPYPWCGLAGYPAS